MVLRASSAARLRWLYEVLSSRQQMVWASFCLGCNLPTCHTTAMIKPTNRPDNMMTDPRNSLDYITDYDNDDNVPEEIVSPDWVAELRERWSR